MMKHSHLLPLGFVLFACFLAPSAPAQTLHDIKDDCGDALAKTTRATIESCAAAYLQMPIRPVLKTIAPGGGFGGGLRAIHTFNLASRNNAQAPWKVKPSGTAAASVNGFLFLEADIDFERPPFGCAQFTDCKGLTTEEAFQIHFFTRRVEAPGLDFYGLGNTTTQATHVLYGERWYEGGMKIVNPATTWLDIGGEIGYVQPHIGPIPNASVPSIETKFSDLTAPGLFSQPGFMRYRIFAAPHHPGDPPFSLDYLVSYDYYHDLENARFSFHKFNTDLTNTFPLKVHGKFEEDPKHKHPVRDWFCDLPRGANKVCEFGYFKVRGVLTLETAAAGQRVPFYFQPTLGGADLYNIDTLRGFLDYRFRAPNLMYIQTEYGHSLPWKFRWMGFMAFYETGRVGTTAGDLGFNQLHHDIGLGFTVSAANHIVARAYIGFGTGEGSRMNYKLGSLF